MDFTQQYNVSSEHMDRLVQLVTETDRRFIDDDVIFTEHMNLFVKSYMVLMCAYLESYLKNLSKHFIAKVDESLSSSIYPRNLFRWSIQKEKYKHNNDGILERFSLGISDEDIDKNLSANPYKTIPFFARFGINLNDIEDFSVLSEQVENIVNKRNNIVHYNDDASDIGSRDIIDNVKVLKHYMKIIDEKMIESVNKINSKN